MGKEQGHAVTGQGGRATVVIMHWLDSDCYGEPKDCQVWGAQPYRVIPSESCTGSLSESEL